MLREVVQSDVPIFFEHQNDPEASAMAAFPAREYDAHMAHWANNVLAVETNYAWTIDVDGAGGRQRRELAGGRPAAGRLLDRARVLGPRDRDAGGGGDARAS